MQIISNLRDSNIQKRLNLRNYEEIIDFAIECIVLEAKSYPSLGLVSERDNGSHPDMNYQLFLKSSHSFREYFKEIVNLVASSETLDFSKLRELGVQQEKRMFKATNNINTHKGLIFAFGIVFYISIYGLHYHLEFDQWPSKIKILVKDLELDFNSHQTLSKGLDLYKKHKIKGARGMALSGYEFVFGQGLNFLQEYKIKYPELTTENYMLILLIFYLSKIDDTTLISKIGLNKSTEVKIRAKEWLNILKIKGWDDFYQFILSVNKECQEGNISPGGCADLTVITIFLDKLSEWKG